jgi:hypothetical protein
VSVLAGDANAFMRRSFRTYAPRIWLLIQWMHLNGAAAVIKLLIGSKSPEHDGDYVRPAQK